MAQAAAVLSHTQIINRLLKPQCLKGNIPADVTWELASEALGEQSTAPLGRLNSLATAVFRAPQNHGDAAAQHAALSAALLDHFNKFFNEPLYRTMAGLMRLVSGDTGEIREGNVLRMLAVWLGLAAPAPQPSLMTAIQVMTEQHRLAVASVLFAEADVETMQAAAQAVFHYMTIPQPEDQADIAHAFELYDIAEQAMAQPQQPAANAAAHEVPQAAGGAALPDAELGLPNPLHLPFQGDQLPLPQGAENIQAEIIMRHENGDPALAIRPPNSKTAARLLALIREVPNVRDAVVEITHLCGSLPEPAVHGKYPAAAAAFFTDNLQLLHPGGGGGVGNATKSSRHWPDTRFQFASILGDNPQEAKTLLAGAVHESSFDVTYTVNQQAARRCLVLNATEIDVPTVVTALHKSGEDARHAIPFLFDSVFKIVSEDERFRCLADSDINTGFSLHADAAASTSLRELLSAITDGLATIGATIGYTKKTRRSRLAALAVITLASFHTIWEADNTVGKAIWDAQSLVQQHRDNPLRENIRFALTREWVHRLVAGGSMLVGISPAQQAAWHMSLQQPAAQNAPGTMAPPVDSHAVPSMAARSGAGGTRPTAPTPGYRCPHCLRAGHHLVDCYSFGKIWKSAPEATVRQRYEQHLSAARLGAPPAPGVDGDVDSSHKAFMQGLQAAEIMRSKRAQQKRARTDDP